MLDRIFEIHLTIAANVRYFILATFHVGVNHMILCLEIWNLSWAFHWDQLETYWLSRNVVVIVCCCSCGVRRIMTDSNYDKIKDELWIIERLIGASLATAYSDYSLLNFVFWSKIDWVCQSKLSGIEINSQILFRLEPHLRTSNSSLQWILVIDEQLHELLCVASRLIDCKLDIQSFSVADRSTRVHMLIEKHSSTGEPSGNIKISNRNYKIPAQIWWRCQSSRTRQTLRIHRPSTREYLSEIWTHFNAQKQTWNACFNVMAD